MKYLLTTIISGFSLVVSLSAFAQTQTSAQAPTNASTSPAQTETETADWQICNETSFALRIATAVNVSGKLQPKGWTKVQAGSCMSQAAPEGTARYVYAESSPAHRGGIREWKGASFLCAGEDDFTADTSIGCALQNLSTRPYLSVDPAEKITTLVEIDDFGSKATTAGIQRLLQDNGYEITRIDGVAGRRTSRTMAQFLKENELPTTLTPQQQLEALEASAGEKMQSIGLNICNKSNAKIWTAIGRRRKGNWESKGWWSIEKDECGQVFTESLISADLSFYALQGGMIDEEGAKGEDRSLRSIATTPTQFCIAESRFAVLGRDNCADLGYQAANFRALPIDKPGVTIELTDADFGGSANSGLR